MPRPDAELDAGLPVLFTLALDASPAWIGRPRDDETAHGEPLADAIPA